MKLQRWDKNQPPIAKELEHALSQEELGFYHWSDHPGAIYPWHTHPYPEVRWINSGSIKMGLKGGKEIILNPGDRLDLPAKTEHWAEVVSSVPVVYLCASKT